MGALTMLEGTLLYLVQQKTLTHALSLSLSLFSLSHPLPSSIPPSFSHILDLALLTKTCVQSMLLLQNTSACVFELVVQKCIP